MLGTSQTDKEENLPKICFCAHRTQGPTGKWDSDFHAMVSAVASVNMGPPAHGAWEALMCMKVFLAKPLGTVGSGLRAYHTFRSS